MSVPVYISAHRQGKNGSSRWTCQQNIRYLKISKKKLFYYILLYFIIFYYILLYFIIFYYILLYFILLYFIIFYFILFYFILFYFILFYFILFYFILFYFILLASPTHTENRDINDDK